VTAHEERREAAAASIEKRSPLRTLQSGDGEDGRGGELELPAKTFNPDLYLQCGGLTKKGLCLIL